MTNLKKISDIINSLQAIKTPHEKDALKQNLKSKTNATTIAFLNAQAVNLCWESEDTLNVFNDAQVLLRDGKGMEILLKKSNLSPGLNMNGTDFIPELLDYFKDKTIAIFGSQDPWLTKACEKLTISGHDVVAQIDGFQKFEVYIDLIRNNKPEVILLAQGMPRQEKLARQIRSEFASEKILIICGGAIVDFMANRFQRAPLWIQKIGFEWAFRLTKEPKRLFKRYIIGNLLFLIRARHISKKIKDTGTENGPYNG